MDEDQIAAILKQKEDEEQEGQEPTGSEVPEPENQEPVEEEAPEETPEEEPEADPEEEPEEEERPVSRRESKRIQQLIERMKSADRPAEQPITKAEKKQIIDEGDYDLDEINEMAKAFGEQQRQEGLNEARQMQNAVTFATRLEIDTPKVMAKYKFLDQESDEFDAGRAALINQTFLKVVGYNEQNGTVQNDNIRYNEFVEGLMELVDIQAETKSVESRKNLTKQAAQAGVRPTGPAKTEYQGSDPSKMSDKQLDAVISGVLGGRR